MAEQDRERNPSESESGSTAGGVTGQAGGEADRGAMQTAAAGWTGYAITLAVNLPEKLDSHLFQLAYDAHAAFLCVTFFTSVYALLHPLFEEETEAATAAMERRWCRKMMVLMSVPGAISFALRIFITPATWWRVLLITAATSVLSLLYLRHGAGMISWPWFKRTTSGTADGEGRGDA